MNQLKISIKNAMAFNQWIETFDFSAGAKVYAVYAPNGLMKTSFTRTFEALGQGKQPEEERYGRPSL